MMIPDYQSFQRRDDLIWTREDHSTTLKTKYIRILYDFGDQLGAHLPLYGYEGYHRYRGTLKMTMMQTLCALTSIKEFVIHNYEDQVFLKFIKLHSIFNTFPNSEKVFCLRLDHWC